MALRKFITANIRVTAFQLRRNTDMSTRDIAKACTISTASVQRILTGSIPRRIATGSKGIGRPCKLSVQPTASLGAKPQETESTKSDFFIQGFDAGKWFER